MNKIVCFALAFIMLVTTALADNKVINPTKVKQQRFDISRLSVFNTNFQFQRKRIVFDEDYFFGNDGFYFVKPNQEFDKLLEDKIKRILKKLENQDSDPILPPGQIPIVPPVIEDAQWIDSPDGLDKNVYDLFVKKCASCHSGAKPKAGFTLVDKKRGSLANLSLEQRENVARLGEGVDLDEEERAMPLGAPPLSDEEIEFLKKWVDKRR